jgi:hypothetical protein
VREETRPIVICVHCKLPITPEQRPSVQLKNGGELHVECYDKYHAAERRKMN